MTSKFISTYEEGKDSIPEKGDWLVVGGGFDGFDGVMKAPISYSILEYRCFKNPDDILIRILKEVRDIAEAWGMENGGDRLEEDV